MLKKTKKNLQKTSAKKVSNKTETAKVETSSVVSSVTPVLKEPDTLGGSRIKILKVEKLKTGENKISLADGTVTVLDDKDFEAQKNQ